eukprot:CAMPEP_0179326278 /NCGR_PEP_ID=MMETSP0797-20121207/61341_1 /TAXON_ID=47934 /ORGANISM="Dinophysis acuminata, Strain DAEP01" /LENGTH=45 /DNA_ID= /DNA_START= /DNA_END= /DNA_ORIENTATION=
MDKIRVAAFAMALGPIAQEGTDRCGEILLIRCELRGKAREEGGGG